MESPYTHVHTPGLGENISATTIIALLGERVRNSFFNFFSNLSFLFDMFRFSFSSSFYRYFNIFITSFSLPYDISLIFSRDFSKTGLVKFLEFDDEMLNLLISGVFSRNCIGNKICRFIDMYQDLNRPRYNNIYSENWGIWGMEWGKRSVKELLKHKKTRLS